MVDYQPLEGSWPAGRRSNSARGYFGTLKIANRRFPKLYVSRSVATKMRLRPFTTASLQPCPFVILSPFLAF